MHRHLVSAHTRETWLIPQVLDPIVLQRTQLTTCGRTIKEQQTPAMRHPQISIRRSTSKVMQWTLRRHHQGTRANKNLVREERPQNSIKINRKDKVNGDRSCTTPKFLTSMHMMIAMLNIVLLRPAPTPLAAEGGEKVETKEGKSQESWRSKGSGKFKAGGKRQDRNQGKSSQSIGNRYQDTEVEYWPTGCLWPPFTMFGNFWRNDDDHQWYIRWRRWWPTSRKSTSERGRIVLFFSISASVYAF